MASLDPWYKVVELREEVREGRSFNPDEFAIALEQVVAGTAPSDYSDPAQFFSRTCFTRALSEHIGMVLRRLEGKTADTPPVLSLITQFGGGKTHTLTALYHLASTGRAAAELPGVGELLREAKVNEIPSARVGVFVGNAWDPAEGRETPWIDLARQIAGDKGVEMLGDAAKSAPPGTEALANLFAAAEAPVLLLFDEVLNFMNRHRNMAEHFHAFIHNLTVAATSTPRASAVISLPRSQVEMTEWDQQWQDRLTKIVRRVAKDLLANDEAEISEVVRRRLFEETGNERHIKKVSKAYADWCFERRAQLPSEWTAVDTARTETKAKEFLRAKFEACYPFHPSTLSVFQRKWQALPQFQQTRGTLAMLAQWISWAAADQFKQARSEPLITLGSAPLNVPEFRSILLAQLGESRLQPAIEADLASPMSHAVALDVDTKGSLRDIHQRVGAAILFESSGGQIDKVARLPELRFALGEPEIDTTTIDNTASALENASFFIRKIDPDGYSIHHQATLKKVVNDRRASLDEETEIKPAVKELVQREFRQKASLPVVCFPEDSSTVQDSPKLTLVVIDPESEWGEGSEMSERIADWTKQRGDSPRLYPGSLVWCAKKAGRSLHEKVETWLAWKRVLREVADGILGESYDPRDRSEVNIKASEAEEAAKDEVWASYRFVTLKDSKDSQEDSELRQIDLGAGHSSSKETLCGRIVSALKSEGLLSESVGASYIDRHWPEALSDSGAWPLTGLRQSFLNGSLTRLMDIDTVLREKITDFVASGEFGLASGQHSDGTYDRVWFAEPISSDEVAFESGVFLLRKAKAKELCEPGAQGEYGTPSEVGTDRAGAGGAQADGAEGMFAARPTLGTASGTVSSDPASSDTTVATDQPEGEAEQTTIRLTGEIPQEVWNRLGHKLLPKLSTGKELQIGVDFVATIDARNSQALIAELEYILSDLGLSEKVRIAQE